ncbi:MAG: cell envelope integrity protein CreD [Ferruginibacter sp.]
MINKSSTSGVAARIWFLTSIVFTAGLFVFHLNHGLYSVFTYIVLVFLFSLVVSIPALVAIIFSLIFLRTISLSWQAKFFRLLFAQFLVTFCYGALAAFINVPYSMRNEHDTGFINTGVMVTSLLFSASTVASFILLRIIAAYFSMPETGNLGYRKIFTLLFHFTSKKNTTMEAFEHEQLPLQQQQGQSNKLLIKGLITGVLILLMLIPTIFINNIIKEREQSQIEAVREVSSKWASAQTISGPYLVFPYSDSTINGDGKPLVVKKQLIVLASELDVSGKIFPEERQRSIYKVLLYKSDIKLSGNFKPKWPIDINTFNIDFANAKLCFGISDFKGIEEELNINFDDKLLPLNPGLPLTDLDEVGLSVPVSTSFEAMRAGIPFNMQLKLKGSQQLHFMPLSANSKFSLSSDWPNPSFDGNSLPIEREVNEKGFSAKWNFNQANLPFPAVIRQASIAQGPSGPTVEIARPSDQYDKTAVTTQGAVVKSALAFGVSMVQPADQYDKTMRSVKYAILFIGLTFALFFIVEIMQRKPFHPVQYVLVGLALVIFYTLLLSISEYLFFDYAYLIAASATVLVISLYARSHFNTWKATGVFFTTLGLLYSFIFVLIRLEDTALLVGSIGLFIVLALVMYASRKVNWYGREQ